MTEDDRPATLPRAASAAEAGDRLMAVIREGRFRPGARLPGERDLQEMVMAGRSALREAVTFLAGAGVLDRRGTALHLADDAARIIERLESGLPETGSPDPLLAEAYTARLAVEPGVAVMAARRIDGASRDVMAAALEEVLEAATWNDLQLRMHLFARSYYLGAQNRFLLWGFDRLLKSLLELRFGGPVEARPVSGLVKSEAYDALGQIFRAIGHGNEARADELVRHFLTSRQDMA
jgi:DNA-binding FadR family transcriptional regulator